MDIIIDFQAFKDNDNNFVVKECAITTTDYCFIHHWVIAPPYDFYKLSTQKRREATWLQLNGHGLKWCDGRIRYGEFIKELRHMCAKKSRVFSKGREKCEFLTGILGVSVIAMDNYGIPSIKTLMQDTYIPLLRCFYHNKHKKNICALTNAYKLMLWCTTNKQVF